ncbi:hypothetical protein GBBBJNDB_00348 [Pseudomonas phage Callisto]|nr:hypothetical protein GBBBJNDB_00348 [Pseudomonas phage Callisto]
MSSIFYLSNLTEYIVILNNKRIKISAKKYSIGYVSLETPRRTIYWTLFK